MIERATIKRVVLLRGHKLPDPGTWMLAGTLIGGGVGVTAGAIQDAKHGNNGRWVTEGFAGAGAGFFGSCVVLAGVGVVALVRHNKVVYEAKAPPQAAAQDSALLPIPRR